MGNNSVTFLEEVHQIHNPNRNLFSSRKQKIKHKNVVDQTFPIFVQITTLLLSEEE